MMIDRQFFFGHRHSFAFAMTMSLVGSASALHEYLAAAAYLVIGVMVASAGENWAARSI